MLLIKHHSFQICTQIKIVSPNGHVLKVVSQYHRTYLYRRFFQKTNQINGKINPETGQISLCTAFSSQKIKDNRHYEQLVTRLLDSISENKSQITQIINLIENKKHNLSILEDQSNTTNIPAFITICTKKSQKQNRDPFQPKNKRKQSKCRTYGGNDAVAKKPHNSKVRQMQRYLNNPLQTIEEIWDYENLNYQSVSFKRQVKKIMIGVQNSLARKDTPLKNYEEIKLQKKNYDSIVSSIKSMREQKKSRRITKIQKSGFGKLNIQIQIQRFSVVQRTYKFLQTLPQQLQLSFINNYFSFNDLMQKQQNRNVIIQLAIRSQQLLDYLDSNSQCISFSTKQRILSQLISSAFLLQNKCSSIMTKMGMGNFSIAKNMMIKINNLQSIKNLTEEEKISFEKQIKLGFVQNQMNISRIYSKLFYQKGLMYFKRQKPKNKSRLSQIFSNSNIEEKEVVIDKIYQQCGCYGPKKLYGITHMHLHSVHIDGVFLADKKGPTLQKLKMGYRLLNKNTIKHQLNKKTLQMFRIYLLFAYQKIS